MTTTTKTRTRKARTVAKDIVPKGPCVGFEAIEHLVWRARAASAPPAVYVDLSGFDDAAAAVSASADRAVAEHRARAEEWDQREQSIRACRPVRRHGQRVSAEVPVAVVTSTPEGDNAFYRLNSATGQMEAVPLDPETEKHLAEIKRLHDEQDGTPTDDPGPAAPSPLVAQPPTGPGSPVDDPALDKAPGE